MSMAAPYLHRAPSIPGHGRPVPEPGDRLEVAGSRQRRLPSRASPCRLSFAVQCITESAGVGRLIVFLLIDENGAAVVVTEDFVRQVQAVDNKRQTMGESDARLASSWKWAMV